MELVKVIPDNGKQQKTFFQDMDPKDYTLDLALLY